MRRHYRRSGLRGFLASLLLITALPTLAGVDDGLSALEAGNYGKALQELREPAQTGDPRAQNGMGVLLSLGKGIKKDLFQARQWFTKSAERGDQAGQFNLGVMLLNGVGGDQDVATACMWFHLSATQGYADARDGLEVCRSMLKKKDFTRTKKMAEEWSPKP